jgi:thymidine kinase
MNSKLDVILGPMFSGKTTKLFEIIEKLDKENINYIAVKPQIDDRYTEDEKNNYIISHNLEKKECKVSNNLKDIFDEIKVNNSDKKIQYVLIDEGQFFKNLYNFTILCLEKLKINVIVTGLDGDFQRKPMGEILNLLPIANSITKLTSKCSICGLEAIFTHRIVNDSDQVLIGGSDKYIPLCRNHYLEKNKLVTYPLDF